MIGGSSGARAGDSLTGGVTARRLRRLVIGVAAGLALLVTAGAALHSGAAGDPPPVTQVVDVPASMVATVDVVDASGTVVATGKLVAEPLRVDGLAAGTYHLVVRAETPVEQSGDVAISAARVSRGEPFDVPAGAALVVQVAENLLTPGA